jgi:V/A-type H+-transporting ATPase subunit K
MQAEKPAKYVPRSRKMEWIIAVACALTLSIAAAWLLGKRRPRRTVKVIARGFLTLNALTILIVGALALMWFLAPPATMATGPIQQGTTPSNVPLAAALATGLACIGAGIAVGLVGAAAVGAVAEKPETLGRVLIFVGLAEGIAIYGLIISFMVMTRGG